MADAGEGDTTAPPTAGGGGGSGFDFLRSLLRRILPSSPPASLHPSVRLLTSLSSVRLPARALPHPKQAQVPPPDDGHSPTVSHHCPRWLWVLIPPSATATSSASPSQLRAGWPATRRGSGESGGERAQGGKRRGGLFIRTAAARRPYPCRPRSSAVAYSLCAAGLLPNRPAPASSPPPPRRLSPAVGPSLLSLLAPATSSRPTGRPGRGEKRETERKRRK
uniref:Uncharacterized protein n=1 Tax=Oryza sativa subsp. japonica TaxID=39947 RepID=Q6ZGC4_ORYSJ|nr:hypothetical protein [Oryza sativa Japonica Group]